MTTKIKWRLANRPTPHEVLDLANASILTKEEAREILFSLETDEDREKSSLQEEIKFLRQLVKNLSSNPQQIVQYITKPNSLWEKQPWYGPYYTWANNSINTTGYLSTSGSTTNAAYSLVSGTSGLNSSTLTVNSSVDEPDFTAIKTF